MTIEILIPLLGSILIALAIGSNDTSNALGICIGCGVLKFKKAILFFGVFVLLGIVLQGQKVMKTVGSDLLPVNATIIGVTLVVSGLLLVVSNWRKLPLSCHHVIIGSLTGAGMASGVEVNATSLYHILLSWVISPLGALCFSFFLYKLMEKTVSRLPVFQVEQILRFLLVLSGILIAYNTGANELATVLGGSVYAGVITVNQASYGGGLLVFLGAVLLSARVIETVGKGITKLDPYSGFAAQFGAGISVMVFTTLGMPISTTYCIIGGIIGVGLIKGLKTVRFDMIRKMLISLVAAPVSAFVICFAAVYMIRYLPEFTQYLKEIFAPLYLMLEPLLDTFQEMLELIREPEDFIDYI